MFWSKALSVYLIFRALYIVDRRVSTWSFDSMLTYEVSQGSEYGVIRIPLGMLRFFCVSRKK